MPALPAGARTRRWAALAALGMYADSTAVNPTAATRAVNVYTASWLCLRVGMGINNINYLRGGGGASSR